MRDVADIRPQRHGRGSTAIRRCGAVLLGAFVVVAVLTPIASPAARKDRASATFKRVDIAKRLSAPIRIGIPPLRSLVSRLPVDQACISSFQFDFSPKLNNNTVSSQTTAALTNCFSPNGSHPDLLSGVLFADRGHSTATGCAPVPLAIDGVGSILWNDESSSNFTFRVNTNPLADGFGLEAKIFSGTYAGHKITAVPFLLLVDGVCGVAGGVNSMIVSFGMDFVNG